MQVWPSEDTNVFAYILLDIVLSEYMNHIRLGIFPINLHDIPLYIFLIPRKMLVRFI